MLQRPTDTIAMLQQVLSISNRFEFGFACTNTTRGLMGDPMPPCITQDATSERQAHASAVTYSSARSCRSAERIRSARAANPKSQPLVAHIYALLHDHLCPLRRAKLECGYHAVAVVLSGETLEELRNWEGRSSHSTWGKTRTLKQFLKTWNDF
jgi:hypothetical protein